jgi:hypothetical protein
MPNAEKQKRLHRLPKSAGLALADLVCALYQNKFITADENNKTALLILLGMTSDGDYSELEAFVAEQCPRASPDNPFWGQMREILSEEV